MGNQSSNYSNHSSGGFGYGSVSERGLGGVSFTQNSNGNWNLNNNINDNSNIHNSINNSINNNIYNVVPFSDQKPNYSSIIQFNNDTNLNLNLNTNKNNFLSNNERIIEKQSNVSAFSQKDNKKSIQENNEDTIYNTKGTKPYIDVDKKTPALHVSDEKGSARITTDGVRIINNVDDNNRIVSSVNKNNVSIGSGVKDELKTTNYEVGVDTTLSRDSELYVKRTDIYKNDTNNDKIARVKLNESRVPLEMPICGEVGSVRTTTTIEGDTTIQEVRAGINAPGAACIAAVGVGATVGASELLVATEGASALAVAGTTMALSTTVTE